MKYIKGIIKRVVRKVLSPILKEIQQMENEQRNHIGNIGNEISSYHKRMKIYNEELEAKIDTITNRQNEMANIIGMICSGLDEVKSDNRLNEVIESLHQGLIKTEKDTTNLNHNLKNLSLIINRRHSVNVIRAVFLIHNVESWYTMQPIYERMLEDSEFEPILIAVPRNYNSHDGTFEDKAKEFLENKYGNVISFDDYNSIPDDIMYTINPDIIFRQSPWEIDIPEVFRTENIKQFKICYIPYGIITLPIENEHFNQELHKYAWRLYCESEYHRKCYVKYNVIEDSNVVVSGYTKFEQMEKLLCNHEYADKLEWPIKQSIKPRLRILWAPHHSLEGWFGFSTFKDIYEQMYEFAKENPDVEIVLRPHPALTETMNNSGLISKEDLQDYYDRFNSLSNCCLDTNKGYINLFKWSDILITDGVSFLFEYIITGKPIIHTDSKCNIGFNEFGKQFESSWYKAYSFEDIVKLIERLGSNDDPLKDNRLKMKNKVFDFNEERVPSKLIIDDIKNALIIDNENK